LLQLHRRLGAASEGPKTKVNLPDLGETDQAVRILPLWRPDTCISALKRHPFVRRLVAIQSLARPLGVNAIEFNEVVLPVRVTVFLGKAQLEYGRIVLAIDKSRRWPTCRGAARPPRQSDFRDRPQIRSAARWASSS